MDDSGTHDSDDPSTWSIEKVVHQLCYDDSPGWVTESGARLLPDRHSLEPCFRCNHINGELLLSLDQQALKEELGISSWGQRLSLCKVIDYLRARSVTYQKNISRLSIAESQKPTDLKHKENSAAQQLYKKPDKLDVVSSKYFTASSPHSDTHTAPRNLVAQAEPSKSPIHTLSLATCPSTLGSEQHSSGSVALFQDSVSQYRAKPEEFQTNIPEQTRQSVTSGTDSSGNAGIHRQISSEEATSFHEQIEGDISVKATKITRRIAPLLITPFQLTSQDKSKRRKSGVNANTKTYLSCKAISLQETFYGSMPDDQKIFCYNNSHHPSGSQLAIARRFKYYLQQPLQSGTDLKSFTREPYAALHMNNGADVCFTSFSPRSAATVQKFRIQPVFHGLHSRKRTKALRGLTKVLIDKDWEFLYEFETQTDAVSSDLADYDYLIKKYPAIQDDEGFPVYGESDDDNGYDEETWNEIELEREETKISRSFLSSAEVSSIIDTSLEELKEQWYKVKLNKVELKSHRLWFTAARQKSRKSEIDNALFWRSRSRNRISKIRETIMTEMWRKPAEVKFQCRNIEQSLFQELEYDYYLKILNQDTAPPLPDVSAISKRSTPRLKGIDSEEDLDSDSDFNSTFMDDFVVVDDDEVGLAPTDPMDVSWSPVLLQSTRVETQTSLSKIQRRLQTPVSDQEEDRLRSYAIHDKTRIQDKISQRNGFLPTEQNNELVEWSGLPNQKIILKIGDKRFKLDTGSQARKDLSNAVATSNSEVSLIENGESNHARNLGSYKSKNRTIRDSLDPIAQQRFYFNSSCSLARQQAMQRILLLEKLPSSEDSAAHLSYVVSSQTPAIYLDPHIGKRVKPHQLKGIRFMWREIVENPEQQGCLLAHTMGLGKTMQAISLLVTIAQCNQSREISIRNCIPDRLRGNKILILCPAPLLENWLEELLIWTPHSDSLGLIRKVRYSRDNGLVHAWVKDGGVLLLSYSLLRNLLSPSRKTEDYLELQKQMEPALLETPDIIIADEAHFMKNADSKVNVLAKQFKTTSRIALTGSPLNNHLDEYHAMVDWIAPGYLGSLAQFRSKYSEPINHGLYADSSNTERRISLKKLHILKRDLDAKIDRADITTISTEMPTKFEFFITVPLTLFQKELYDLYVAHVLETHGENGKTGNARLWDWLAVLVLLCNHPACFVKKLRSRSEGKQTPEEGSEGGTTPVPRDEDNLLNEETPSNEMPLVVAATKADPFWNVLEAAVGAFFQRHPFERIEHVEQSFKSLLVQQILLTSMTAGDKVLIFSHSIPTLDYLQDVLDFIECKYLRIDGSIEMRERQKSIKAFNEDNNRETNAFLLSTQAGGVGINLQGANRVIIYDFNFNPTWEEQAIARAYRIGQSKPVFVYRILAGGTFEEVVYNKAIFKTQLFQRVVDKKNPMRYASKSVTDYLFPVKTVEAKDFRECVGKDPNVLDHILGSTNYIQNIELTETFQKEENELLTADEVRDANQELEQEQYRRNDPAGWSKLQAGNSFGFQKKDNSLVKALTSRSVKVAQQHNHKKPNSTPTVDSSHVLRPLVPKPLDFRYVDPALLAFYQSPYYAFPNPGGIYLPPGARGSFDTSFYDRSRPQIMLPLPNMAPRRRRSQDDVTERDRV